MNRRSLIVVLIGVIAALGGLGATTLVRQRRCAGMGGQWLAASGECRTAAGVVSGAPTAADVAVGIFVTLVLGFMLLRVLLFAMGRMPRRQG